jgi:Protein of unknown function (DUF3500)
MKKTSVLFIVTLFVAACNGQGGIEAFKKRFAEAEANNIKQPYEGIVTSKGKEKNLFPIKSTGVTTAPIKDAAEAFLKSLTKEQIVKTQFEIDDKEWQKWSNVDNGIYKRQGISIKEMTADQRTLAFGLMQKALSAKGLQLSKDIMKTDQTLREMNKDTIYDEELYFFTLMGKPSMTEPWGWQIDGHHLVINYFILGDQVVMTPVFMGGEPVITTTGKYAGNTIFQDEQNIGLKFMQSLSIAQQNKATLSKVKGRETLQAEAFTDNKIVDFKGLCAKDMTPAQKEQLLFLANQYISNMEEGHAKIEMEDIRKHLDNTWFAWIGKTDSSAMFYYRIHSPIIMIEFDHQEASRINDKSLVKNKNHIHTVVRTPNGNDYGKDLLKQHLEKYHKHN